uniref:Uncharacterized protein n=1 Tax=Solanum lycopersicum TaxID=4081 RepID=A0A3Q7FLW4_SOLLC
MSILSKISQYTGITLSEQQPEYCLWKKKVSMLLRLIKYDRIILVYVTIVLIIIFSEVLEHIGHDFIRKFISCFEFTLADDGFLVFQVMNIFNAKRIQSSDFMKEYIFLVSSLTALSRVTSVMTSAYMFFLYNCKKTLKKLQRPYEKEQFDAKLKLVGEYGLSCKRELLTLDEKDPRRILKVLALNVENFLECRLETLMFKTYMVKSIHHARVLISEFSLTSPFGDGRPKRVK